MEQPGDSYLRAVLQIEQGVSRYPSLEMALSTCIISRRMELSRTRA